LSNPTGPSDVFTTFATAMTAIAARKITIHRQSSASTHHHRAPPARHRPIDAAIDRALTRVSLPRQLVRALARASSRTVRLTNITSTLTLAEEDVRSATHRRRRRVAR